MRLAVSQKPSVDPVFRLYLYLLNKIYIIELRF